jgi:hypothetical protein
VAGLLLIQDDVTAPRPDGPFLHELDTYGSQADTGKRVT